MGGISGLIERKKKKRINMYLRMHKPLMRGTHKKTCKEQ